MNFLLLTMTLIFCSLVLVCIIDGDSAYLWKVPPKKLDLGAIS